MDWFSSFERILSQSDDKKRQISWDYKKLQNINFKFNCNRPLNTRKSYRPTQFHHQKSRMQAKHFWSHCRNILHSNDRTYLIIAIDKSYKTRCSVRVFSFRNEMLSAYFQLRNVSWRWFNSTVWHTGKSILQYPLWLKGREIEWSWQPLTA